MASMMAFVFIQKYFSAPDLKKLSHLKVCAGPGCDDK